MIELISVSLKPVWKAGSRILDSENVSQISVWLSPIETPSTRAVDNWRLTAGITGCKASITANVTWYISDNNDHLPRKREWASTRVKHSFTQPLSSCVLSDVLINFLYLLSSVASWLFSFLVQQFCSTVSFDVFCLPVVFLFTQLECTKWVCVG